MGSEDIKKAIAIFAPALALDRVVSRKTRRELLHVLGVSLLVLAVLIAVALTLRRFELPADFAIWASRLDSWRPNLTGLLSIVFSLWLVARALEAFYDSHYFVGLKSVLPETGLDFPKPKMTFEAADVLYDIARGVPPAEAFSHSRLGRRVLVRLALERNAVAYFFKIHRGAAAEFKVSAKKPDEPVGLSDVATAVLDADHEFLKFLSLHDISPKEFAGAAEWVERVEQTMRGFERFWGRDVLGRIPGIGKDWSLGAPYALMRFARDVTEEGMRRGTGETVGGYKAEVEALEAVLARSGESNALLVAEEGAGALDIVFGLGMQIIEGTVLPPLEHKRLFLFDGNAFIAAMKDKARFESEFLHILNASVRAGNIIFVIPDLPQFIESAKGLGSDIVALLDPYLASPAFQVVAFSSPEVFHQGLEENSKILHRFEKIAVKEQSTERVLELLEDRALAEEARSGILFSYQSLVAVAEGAKRYFPDGVLSDRAMHLLSELPAAVVAKKKMWVERRDVLDLIESKTGVPTGEVSGDERDKLLNLEKILHERIIGQDEAVRAISNAMCRARSDITNPERPMGSFLFLGPTGVGKTETTKALASAFFGKEESVIRLDMSEYRTDDALTRLIGSFEGGKAGILSSKLREQPYGVLLLDEFEKTNKEVIDLFLQILDEGFFSDMAGRRVNARNLIIIATSNAGSDLIWQMLHAEGSQALDKDKIVAEIINRGIFKPELLNRFDGVVLFHPLSTENLQKIAGLMLKKLQKRLAEKGIELVVNEALLRSVMAAGTDPEFGARPMNRAIQEKVEQVIAKKIIAGEARAGSRIELSESELA